MEQTILTRIVLIEKIGNQINGDYLYRTNKPRVRIQEKIKKKK